MVRINEAEILDSNGVPDKLGRPRLSWHRRHPPLAGRTSAIVRAIRRDPFPVSRILDVGCATRYRSLSSASSLHPSYVPLTPRTGSAQFAGPTHGSSCEELPRPPSPGPLAASASRYHAETFARSLIFRTGTPVTITREMRGRSVLMIWRLSSQCAGVFASGIWRECIGRVSIWLSAWHHRGDV